MNGEASTFFLKQKMEDEAIQQRIIVKDTALKRVIREFVALKRCLGQNERDEVFFHFFFLIFS